MFDDIQVQRALPPDALLKGIAVCGGVENYYRYCINKEKENRRRVMQMAMEAGNPQEAAIQAHALFPDNANEIIETAVTRVGKRGLNIVSDLIEAGLSTPLPNWWGVPSLRRGRIGEGGNARRTMVPDSRGERFVLSRDGVSWPIYCTWANFSFDARTLAVGQRMGTPLDVSHTEEATYRDNEMIEDQSLNGLTDSDGNTMTIDGMSAPGLLSSTTTFDYATWTGLTGAQIVDEVQSAIELLRLNHFRGPFRLYVPGNYTTKLTSDYGTAYPKTIIARLQELGPYGGRNLEVRFSDLLPDNRVIIVQMTSDVVDVVVGQQPVPVSWTDGPGWNTYWVVLACVIFRMFQNKNGDYGVAVGNLT